MTKEERKEAASILERSIRKQKLKDGHDPHPHRRISDKNKCNESIYGRFKESITKDIYLR